jgi:hypothetical protein
MVARETHTLTLGGEVEATDGYVLYADAWTSCVVLCYEYV